MAENSIRLTRRKGRNVFVFQRNGSDLFELEEQPPRFNDPSEWTEGISGIHTSPPPVPDAAKKPGGTWSRKSITGLARTLNE